MRLFLLLFFMASGAAAQENFWVGIWHFPGGDCEMLQADGGSIEFTVDEFYGLESHCSMQNPTEIRDMDGVLFDLTCMAEGYEENYRMLLLKEDGNRLTVHTRSSTRTYDLCPSF